MWIYDRAGVAALLATPGGRIVTPDAKQAGWLDGAMVFTLVGQHVGWFSGGLLRDTHGAVCGFSQAPSDSVRPALPVPTLVQSVLTLPAASVKPALTQPAARPADRPEWSPRSVAELLSAPPATGQPARETEPAHSLEGILTGVRDTGPDGLHEVRARIRDLDRPSLQGMARGIEQTRRGVARVGLRKLQSARHGLPNPARQQMYSAARAAEREAEHGRPSEGQRQGQGQSDQ